jgi:multisubunit Na+/H+ antiporter MnhG subunit
VIFDLHSSFGVLAVWEVLCLALLWTVFCRSVHITKAVRLEIRLAVFAVGLAALFGLGAPAYGWVPDLVVMVIVLAFVLQQLALAHAAHGRASDVRQSRMRRRLGDSQ